MKKNNRDNDQLALAGTEEADILARLSDRVEKAVGTIQELRRERDTMRSRITELERELANQRETSQRLSTVEEDYERFRSERSEIRNRIEDILSNLESLDETAETEEAVAE